ncbi:putative leucine-rich repeat receptor-like protein kinase [Heracleum sosnowskyi]|uniref:Leucine-rich repeat receptor-like protein kinase n=1 Tax=Heracleum sosnowskyi TaxID=360622 RepID=A0AAD8HPX0_9APIA|nr:putative leucine-rich repeat receptor-like protein kinase [Heracleum sosnowskyi]
MLLKIFTLSLLLLVSLGLSNPDFTTLLSFKISADSSSSLPWSSSAYPCSWLGVTCHPITHRVTKLILNNFNLTGSIQTLTRLTHLHHLSLHHNYLSVAPSFSSLPNLKHLYLSHNEFSGEFPAGVSSLHRLLRLDLSYNNFSGEIPMNELTQLTHLKTLFLEFNSFTGTLNPNGSSVSSLIEFNVSENTLSGKIPDYLSSFSVSSFSGNSHLCGMPLLLGCYDHTAHSKPVAGDDKNGKNRVLGIKKNVRNSAKMMIISVVVVVVIFALVIVTWCTYRNKEKKMKVKEWYNRKYGGLKVKPKESSVDDQEMVCFEGCKGFDKVDELLTASAEMLGKGSVGTTYKVEINGSDVVVKRVRLRESSSRAKKKEIDGYLRENIGGLRNPNVLSLRAFSSSKDELLLVYDYLSNGSLFTLLHGNRGPGRTPVGWNTRLKVALGSAQGLAFLHSRKLVHGNLTSSNIIIDHLGNPCISDISLNLLLQIPSSLNNPYRAPELVQAVHTTHNNKSFKSYTKKCDVYSFGVVLLEILTGKTAWIEGEGSLVNWVEGIMKQQDNWIWEVFDFEMLRYKEMEGEMKALLHVALLCLVSSPNQRLEMFVVKKMIDDIKVRDTGSGEFQESISNGTLTNSGSSSFSESV